MDKRSSGGVTVSLSVTGPQSTGAAGIDSLSGFENLTGGSGADVLTGNAGNNSLFAGAGNDTVSFFGGPAVTVNLATGTGRVEYLGNVISLKEIKKAIGDYGLNLKKSE